MAFLLITLYVQNEYSFDRYNEKKDRIYRVIKQEVGNFYFGTDFFTVTPAPLAPALPEEYPQVETATRIFNRNNVLMGIHQQTYLEPEVYAISPEAFDIFSFEIKEGNLEELLTEKFTAVLSESMARKYFGDQPALGQTIRYRNEHPYTVVGSDHGDRYPGPGTGKKITHPQGAIADDTGSGKVSAASSMPNRIDSNSGAQWPGKPKELEIMLYAGTADYDYVDLFGLELAEGRGFSREFGDESKSVLLNESAVKALGWEEEPIGRQMINWSGDTATVVGVLKDFHQHSLHLAIAPLQLFFSEKEWQVAVKVSGAQLPETMAAIEARFRALSPEYPFEYHFFDEIFEKDYLSDQKTGTMARWFTLLIIIIACLGLYGLSAFSTEMRIREIGIRKVLGASVTSLLLLLSRSFLSLILLSFLIAVALSWLTMQQWLHNFVYHIPIGFSIFLWMLALLLGHALLTVGFKTYVAASNKPVDVLQQE